MNQIQAIPETTTPSTKRGFRAKWVFLVIVLAVPLCFGLSHLTTSRTEDKKPKGKPPAPVTVALASLADVPVQVRSIGAVVPMNSVSVKSRVSGKVNSIHFKEGQSVKKRDLLFTIDPRALKAEWMRTNSEVLKQDALVAQARAAIEKDKAALAQVKANLEKDKAFAKLAQVNAKRYSVLANAGAVSQVDKDSKDTESESTAAVVIADNANIKNAEAQIIADEAALQNALAQVESAKAAREQARVQLNWTTVNAPISGRTGRILVLQGNTVRPDEEILVTINQLAPIFVEFSVPDDQFELVQKYSKNTSLKASAFLKGRNISRLGNVTFMDNTVDNTTGTVKLKAVYDNADSVLWPGKFVDVMLTLTTLKDAITVPSQAVQTGQSGLFVRTLKDGKTAHMQTVTTGPTVAGRTVITNGLKVGESVVTDGQLQLAEGSKVNLIR